MPHPTAVAVGGVIDLSAHFVILPFNQSVFTNLMNLGERDCFGTITGFVADHFNFL